MLDDGRGAMVVDGGFQPLDPFALAVLAERHVRQDGPKPLEGGPPAGVRLESTYLDLALARHRGWSR